MNHFLGVFESFFGTDAHRRDPLYQAGRKVVVEFLKLAAEPAFYVLVVALSFSSQLWVFRSLLLASLGWKLAQFWITTVMPLIRMTMDLLSAFRPCSTGNGGAAAPAADDPHAPSNFARPSDPFAGPLLFSTPLEPTTTGNVASNGEYFSADDETQTQPPSNALATPFESAMGSGQDVITNMKRLGLDEAEARKAIEMAQSIMPAMMNVVAQTMHQQFFAALTQENPSLPPSRPSAAGRTSVVVVRDESAD